MGILIYLIIFRIKRIFDFKAHPIKTISIILFLCITVYYGYLLAYLYNSPEFQEEALSQNELKHYLILFLAIITLLRGFFPTYIPLKNIIGKNYPLSRLERFSYNTINEFIYPFYFGIILFVGAFYGFANSAGIKFIAIVLSWVVIAHFLKRLFQFLIEFNLQGTNVLLILFPISIFIIFYHIIFSEILEYFSYAISLSTVLVLIVLNYMFESKSKEPKIITKTNSEKSSGNFYFLKLLLNNKSLRTMSLVSIAYKIFILLMIWNIAKNSEHSSSEELIFYLFISPVVLFSYFFNNFFGFAPTMWFSMSKIGADLITYSEEMLKVLFVPLIIDSALTIVYFIVSGTLDFANISFYLSNVIVLFAIGVLTSFYLPKQVKNLFNMSGNTSMWSNLISMFAVALSVLLTIYFAYVTLLVSILIVIGLYYLTKDKISKTKYKLFDKLFN